MISDTESTGDTEEMKIQQQVEKINLNAGTTPEVSEEEQKKAEAFKKAGNEAFKGKEIDLLSFSLVAQMS